MRGGLPLQLKGSLLLSHSLEGSAISLTVHESTCIRIALSPGLCLWVVGLAALSDCTDAVPVSGFTIFSHSDFVFGLRSPHSSDRVNFIRTVCRKVPTPTTWHSYIRPPKAVPQGDKPWSRTCKFVAFERGSAVREPFFIRSVSIVLSRLHHCTFTQRCSPTSLHTSHNSCPVLCLAGQWASVQQLWSCDTRPPQ